METDFLIIGSGVAGLSFALDVAKHGKVILVSKADIEETNTRYAQGGIASVTYNPDNFEKHVNDTLATGAGICDKETVNIVVKEAPARIRELVNRGVNFDKNREGKYDLGMEGGHSEARVLHHKDNTGYTIQKALSDQVKQNKNIHILENHFAVDIITQHHLGRLVRKDHKDIECYGAYVMNLKTTKITRILSKVTLLATGGSGNAYQVTTNPKIATGDGIAMAYRAKGIIENMEFFQFHPTSLYNPGERPSFLITEALRGYGAMLKNAKGEEFAYNYDQRGHLAPRDIVARAIDHELKSSGDDCVYLDCSNISPDNLKDNFPNIYKKCLSIGIDITKNRIPVVPAAHYQCGGVKVNKSGESTIHNLYATGEVSYTGLHGANRLASNSLLEAVVFAHRAAKDAITKKDYITLNQKVPEWHFKGTKKPDEMVLITHNMKEVQQIMTNYVGIVRSDARLKRALSRLEIIYLETEEIYNRSPLSQMLCELRNIINVAYLIIKMASQRKKSIGLHYNIDHPPE